MNGLAIRLAQSSYSSILLLPGLYTPVSLSSSTKIGTFTSGLYSYKVCESHVDLSDPVMLWYEVYKGLAVQWLGQFEFLF